MVGAHGVAVRVQSCAGEGVMIARDFIFVGCEAGHEWVSVGGCNAGCSNACSCSVPVNKCRRCGDCDYGENDEAAMVRSDCALLRDVSI
jgi:hypothetical protein